MIIDWVFTTMPGKWAMTIPLLVVLHGLIGIANAGINISSTTIRMKMAPRAQSTAYLTGASLAANLGAGISPLLGGLFADFFSVRYFQISFEWVDPTRTFDFPALYLTGFVFLFVVAFVFGLLTMNFLTRIREEGEVNTQVVMDELIAQTRDNLRVLNSVPGLSMMSHFPSSSLRHIPRVAGLDVAVGVTAFQLASSTRTAVETVARGTHAARDVRERVNHSVLRAVR